MKKILSCFLLGFLILLSAEKVVKADRPDFDKKGSINVYMRATSGNLVSGGSLEVYKVADVSSTNLGNKYVNTSGFTGAGYSLEEEKIADLALDLYYYALENHIHGDVYENVTGTVNISDLASGLYLIDNKRAPANYNRIEPFLVSVPFKLDDTWIYEVDASPKMSLLTPKPPSPVPDPKPEPSPSPAPIVGPEPGLAPDGQLNDGLLPGANKNIVKYIQAPLTGDISGDVLAIMICSVILCGACVFLGVYIIRSRKTSIAATDSVADEAGSNNVKSDSAESGDSESDNSDSENTETEDSSPDNKEEVQA